MKKKIYVSPTIEISQLREICVIATSDGPSYSAKGGGMGFSDEEDDNYRQGSSRGFGSATPWD